ncbi:uncharacterized protein ANIA_03856 [Aspergillus nidulans FGSC A4]|uniref:Uncharacterized protein n=1 Tax=Emericella nidulans (strain FGSC A4 / ATCC 38163 / CBS 112.46 / NRRL 194 / M139) TaxID=227321 RepID=C8V6H6_EMENI|nr:hypothetical protein [Aspergillus nidulans FGSC A4]CBF75232.1 TPA: conserved hypothetical protein [Aspergillus nidulans FGSC A4]
MSPSYLCVAPQRLDSFTTHLFHYWRSRTRTGPRSIRDIACTSTMKFKVFHLSTTGYLIILNLSCIIVSASSFESLLRGLHPSVLTRSLPGSLAFVPGEAIGNYQPPPGPIHYGPLPTTDPVSSEAPAIASAAANADGNDIGYGSRRAMAATESPDAADEVTSRIPSVTEMDAMIAKAQAASANKGVAWPSMGLIVPILVPFLQL